MNRKYLTLAAVSCLILIALPWLGRESASESPATAPPPLPVGTITVQPRAYKVVIDSHGTVQAKIASTVVAQVEGEITKAEPALRRGSHFERGQTLLQLDQRDLQAQVTIARAELENARQQLAEERARSVQAREDWQRLGNDAGATELTQRLPQLRAAEAGVAAASARLDSASLNLERATLVAPYNGRVAQQYVDLGDFVSRGTPIADIYATDAAEIRLPVRESDLAYLALPNSVAHTHAVSLESQSGEHFGHKASLVRHEGEVDATTRQLHVIAEVSTPFAATPGSSSPLYLGQYVRAKITGRQLERAIVVPLSAIHRNEFVYVVEQARLQRRRVSIAWYNHRDALIESGLAAGDELVVSPLGDVTSGTPVRIEDQQLAVAQ
jgi:RND family efflux transporter MFP subunit